MDVSIVAGSVYQHYKRGKYLVLFVLDDETDARAGNKTIVYMALENKMVFARDYTEFAEVIEWPDGIKRPRFSAVEDKPTI